MGMQGFMRKIDKLERISRFDIAAAVTDIINSNQEYMTKILKSQLASGKDANNEAVTVFGNDFYAPETLAAKSQIGGLGGETRWITNYMSGAFYRFLYVRARGTKFEFHSDVEYYWEIIAQSGRAIMELSPENCARVSNELIKPELDRRLKEYLNV